jgi:hypothetical protein
MVRIISRLKASGPHFSPAAFAKKHGVLLEQTREVGDRSRIGRVIDEGSANLPLGPDEGDTHLSVAVAQEIHRLEPLLREAGADDLILDLCINYDTQCNLAFEADMLRCIGASRINVHVSCYGLGEEEFAARYG